MAFVRKYDLAARPEPDDLLLAASAGKALFTGGVEVPALPTASAMAQADGETLLLAGELDGRRVWLAPLPPSAPEGCRILTVKPIIPLLSPSLAAAVFAGLSLSFWLARNRFCGVCGTKTAPDATERAMRCPSCGELFYPTASPAVIVAVEKAGRLLLAHNRDFPPGRFSTIAGFVDPGETFEDAVRRELREEVGIEVEGVAYAGSQGWPFPNSLMAAFRAEWKSGELAPDGTEIAEAGWFAPEALPDIPAKGTVARELIDAWLCGRSPGAA
jgi:NAD+ diphosphatase